MYDKYNIALDEPERKADMEATATFLWDAKKKLAGYEKGLIAVPASPSGAAVGPVGDSNKVLKINFYLNIGYRNLNL